MSEFDHNDGISGGYGTIAFVNEGDSITIDAHALKLELNVPAAEIEKRRAAWTAPKPRYTRGVQAKFAFNAGSAKAAAFISSSPASGEIRNFARSFPLT